MLKNIIIVTVICFEVMLSGCRPHQELDSNDQTRPAEQNNHEQMIAAKTIMKDSTAKKQMKTGIPIVSRPNHIPVLVNKDFTLPANYQPADLVYPDVFFLADKKAEKRMMRKEAAHAVEQLFQAAAKDGIYLAGISAYRSHSTQTEIFKKNVERDGFEIAVTYSALPGTSEHETGLAIDVSDSRGTCPATDCFGKTKEAAWLAKHAHEHGFIVRYPAGKQDITGYKYEPWHLRYVGDSIAAEITNRGITLEEYTNAIPVVN
jgi:zinc D-Ala-D-Ala carboxypeptidase